MNKRLPITLLINALTLSCVRVLLHFCSHSIVCVCVCAITLLLSLYRVCVCYYITALTQLYVCVGAITLLLSLSRVCVGAIALLLCLCVCYCITAMCVCGCYCITALFVCVLYITLLFCVCVFRDLLQPVDEVAQDVLELSHSATPPPRSVAAEPARGGAEGERRLRASLGESEPDGVQEKGKRCRASVHAGASSCTHSRACAQVLLCRCHHRGQASWSASP